MTASKESIDALFPQKNHSWGAGNLLPHVKPAEVTSPEVQEQLSDLEALLEASPMVENPHKPPTCRAPPTFLGSHMVIIDQLLMNPQMTGKELAKATGFTRGWLSRVMSSDSFQAKLAERQKALCDPIVLATIENRLKGLTNTALEILEEKLETSQNTDLALEVLSMSTKALGMGAKQPQVVVQQSFIAQVPAKSVNAGDWAKQHRGFEVEADGEVETVEVVEGSGATEVSTAPPVSQFATTDSPSTPAADPLSALVDSVVNHTGKL